MKEDAATAKPVLSADEKKALRTARRLEKEAKEAAEHAKREAEEKAQFAKDTANWNERLLNAVLEFTAASGDMFSVVKNSPVHGGNSTVTFTVPDEVNGRGYEDSYTVNVVPVNREDLWAMTSVERELAARAERQAEYERKLKLRAQAVAKLTEEERKALGV